jgi:hypothetical protein
LQGWKKKKKYLYLRRNAYYFFYIQRLHYIPLFSNAPSEMLSYSPYLNDIIFKVFPRFHVSPFKKLLFSKIIEIFVIPNGFVIQYTCLCTVVELTDRDNRWGFHVWQTPSTCTVLQYTEFHTYRWTDRVNFFPLYRVNVEKYRSYSVTRLLFGSRRTNDALEMCKMMTTASIHIKNNFYPTEIPMLKGEKNWKSQESRDRYDKR